MPKPILALTFLLLTLPCFSQEPFRVMFYNAENLFDTVNNPDTDDDEFTPEGNRRWTNKRYYAKINNLAKVISSAGEWNIPALVGLCEIENEKTLHDLTLYSPLKEMQYRFILGESNDPRGINTALLYQRDQFRYIEHQNIQVDLSAYNKTTRHILHVSGEILTRDTLDVFVCHFPSRRDGQRETEILRTEAAHTLQTQIDSLFDIRTHAQIIVMGDFNDEPHNKSLAKTLQAQPLNQHPSPHSLYNLFHSLARSSRIGTYKYHGEWNFLDQIIVSGNLLNPLHRFHALPETAAIFHPDYLLTEDITQSGKRPKKTYHGYKYESGFSDHLPVFVDFILHLPQQ